MKGLLDHWFSFQYLRCYLIINWDECMNITSKHITIAIGWQDNELWFQYLRSFFKIPSIPCKGAFFSFILIGLYSFSWDTFCISWPLIGMITSFHSCQSCMISFTCCDTLGNGDEASEGRGKRGWLENVCNFPDLCHTLYVRSNGAPGGDPNLLKCDVWSKTLTWFTTL